MIRACAMLALAALVAAACVYAGLRAPRSTLDECLSAPASHDGAFVVSPHEATVGRVAADGFTLRWGGGEIPVRGRAAGARPGDYVRVAGIFRGEGYLEARAVHVGRYRRMKMAVSAAAAAAVFVLFRRGYYWDRRRRGIAAR
jgi:hypothetical protein